MKKWMLEQTCGLHYSNTDKKTYKQWFEKNSNGKTKLLSHKNQSINHTTRQNIEIQLERLFSSKLESQLCPCIVCSATSSPSSRDELI